MPTATPTPRPYQVAAAALEPYIPWLSRPPSPEHWQVLDVLTEIWFRDPELAVVVAQMPFHQGSGEDGGITQESARVFTDLGRIAQVDRGLALKMTGMPWIRPDLTRIRGGWTPENEAMAALATLVEENPALASRLVNSAEPTGVLHLLRLSYSLFLGNLVDQFPLDYTERLLTAPWLMDGLDAEKLALLTTLMSGHRYWEPLDPWLESLLSRSYHVRSKTVRLPLAGEVTLWAFRNDPFPPGDGTLAIMEEGARGGETLTGLPFPHPNHIVLILPPEGLPWGGAYYGEFVVVGGRQTDHYAGALLHEVGHHFMGYQPIWLSEGGAELVKSYVLDGITQRRIAGQLQDRYAGALVSLFPDDLGEHSTIQAQYVRDSGAFVECLNQGNPNLYTAHTLIPNEDLAYHICYRIGGHVLMTGIFFLFGEEAFKLALQELNQRLFEIPHPTDQEVYAIFRKHVPAGREQEFNDLYRRIHGGPFINA